MESGSCAETLRVGDQRRLGWRWWAVLVGVVVVGAGVRFWDLGAQSLWFDEGYSAWVMGLSPGRIVEVIRNDASPPLYYLILKVWSGLFGESEAALRSLSAVAAVISLMLVPAIARRITRSGLATVAAGCVYAVSVLQIQYAQEARSYGLASMLAAVSLYAAIRRMQGTRHWLWLVWVSCLASVYLHNMMWFYVAGLCFAYVAMPGRVGSGRRIGELAVLCGAIVIGYAPWIPALLGQMAWLKGNFWAGVPTGDALASVLVAVGGMKLMHLGMVTSHGVWVAAVVLVGLCVAALLGRSREQVRYGVALIGYGVLPVLAVYLHAQVGQSYFVEKVFTASTLSMPLLVGMAIAGRARWLAAGLAMMLIVGSAVSVYGQLAVEKKEEWREAVAFVNGFEREGTLVVFVANEGELLYDYYTRRAGVVGHETAGAPQRFLELEPPRTIQRVKDEADLVGLEKLLEESRPARVLLVYAHWEYSDPQELTRAMLARRMELVGLTEFHWVNVLEYRAAAPATQALP